MKILFVCMGNICRSPTAEAAFRRVVQEHAPDLEVEIDSAGTHDYHVGEPPDSRAIKAAATRGLDLKDLRARTVEATDFERFDLILAMDRLNYVTLIEHCPAEYHERVKLFLEYAPAAGVEDVPDPYYGGANGFEHVLDLVQDASFGLLESLRKQRRAR
jgi:protein-tyrosine phosphatase